MRLSILPTLETYAEFANGYDGSCPLLASDGLCDLHRTCGPNALPTICRQYPRAFLSDLSYEACTVNSCERTLELLFEHDEPLSFHMEAMDVSIFAKRSETVPMVVDQTLLRARSLSVLSDRSVSLTQRLLRLRPLLSLSESESCDAPQEPTPWNEDEVQTVRRVLFHLVDGLTSQNRSIEELVGEAGSIEDDNRFAIEHGSMKRHLDEVVSKHEIHFEKLLANHMFYRRYPFMDGLKSTEDAYSAMIGTFAVVRYFTFALMRLKNTLEDFVDVVARLFRVIAHTRFEATVFRLMKEINADDPATLKLLCAY